MRIVALLLPLAACGQQQPSSAQVDQGGAERIPCAKAGVSQLQRDCVVETSDSPDGQVLTIRHPDGGFRRLRVVTDGRGVIAADGADPATVRIVDPQRIEVTVAGEGYELPATMKSGEAPK